MRWCAPYPVLLSHLWAVGHGSARWSSIRYKLVVVRSTRVFEPTRWRLCRVLARAPLESNTQEKLRMRYNSVGGSLNSSGIHVIAYLRITCWR